MAITHGLKRILDEYWPPTAMVLNPLSVRASFVMLDRVGERNRYRPSVVKRPWWRH